MDPTEYRRGRWTILIIPHESASTVRSLAATRGWLAILLACGLVLFSGLTYLTHDYFQLRAELRQEQQQTQYLQELTAQQRQTAMEKRRLLEGELAVMRDEARELRHRLEHITNLERQLRIQVAELEGDGDLVQISTRETGKSSSVRQVQSEEVLLAAAWVPPGLGETHTSSLHTAGLPDLFALQNFYREIRTESQDREAYLTQIREAVRESQEALIPSIWPVEGRVSSAFGFRLSPFSTRRQFHSGIDIAAPTGTPIRAAADGRVVFSGWDGGLGRVVILDHGSSGYRTLYAHNSRNAVAVGDTVRRGDTIAYVGSTGYSTGPHLHYEVHYRGDEVDPRPYMSRHKPDQEG